MQIGMKKPLSYYVRYYLLFCPTHFMVHGMQPAISMEERSSFMKRFHENDTTY